jgi:predicted nucleic acid-binding protein
MSDKIFVNTNILIYCRDASEKLKQPVAKKCIEKLWFDHTGVISTQVLNEYYVTVTKKLKPGMTQKDAWDDVCALMAWSPLSIDLAILHLAKIIEEKYSISWWDSMIVAAAKIGGCKTIYSEGLSNGQMIAGVKIVNPFLD